MPTWSKRLQLRVFGLQRRLGAESSNAATQQSMWSFGDTLGLASGWHLLPAVRSVQLEFKMLQYLGRAGKPGNQTLTPKIGETLKSNCKAHASYTRGDHL